jgi:hypothetical protein
MRGAVMSSRYRPRPETRRTSSLRLSEAPTSTERGYEDFETAPAPRCSARRC